MKTPGEEEIQKRKKRCEEAEEKERTGEGKIEEGATEIEEKVKEN